MIKKSGDVVIGSEDKILVTNFEFEHCYPNGAIETLVWAKKQINKALKVESKK